MLTLRGATVHASALHIYVANSIVTHPIVKLTAHTNVYMISGALTPIDIEPSRTTPHKCYLMDDY